MKVIIFSNGLIHDYNFIWNNILQEDIIICCDGGIKHTKKLNIIPHYILGDLDSAPKDLVEYYKGLNVKFKKFNSEKDETDTEIGINFAIELGAVHIDLYGCMGTRFDHTLSNAHNLMIALNKNVNARIINEHNSITLINKSIILLGKKGQTISLIPLTTEVTGITTTGLKYPLNNATLTIGASRGISNIVEDDTAQITIKSGYLFVIQTTD